MSPKMAELPRNVTKLRKKLKSYYDKASERKSKFSIGDKVRVQRQKGKFGRGYDNIFSDEIFNICRINRSLPIPMYSLTSFDGSVEIMANFYGNELQKVSGFPFKIVDILKTEKSPQGAVRLYAQILVNNEPLYAWVNQDDL